MKPDELRELFLKFFEEKGHTRVQSDLLVPQDDPTLLFSSAGMNQFKSEFLGKGRPLKRAASCQKCLRTGDIDNVGVTAYHHTFFEMLGNFSFNDYFKKDAQVWAWEFMTERLRIPSEKLVVSVYEDDDEAYGIWRDDAGVPEKRIYRFNSKHNFWPAEAPEKGPNGLCGPCAEIFYDWGQGSFPCDNPKCDPSCDCGRYCEVWNLVFQVYNRTGYKQLEPLAFKNIDTGMGFERLLAVVNGVRSNYETELFMPIIDEIAKIAGTAYKRDTEAGRHMRRIADHIRALCFTIAENIIPDSADERGYILRKLLRRAYRDGRAIGVKDETFLYRLVEVVGKVFKNPYPEILQRRKNIGHILKEDEEKFARVLDRGELRLQEEIEKVQKGGGKIFAGEKAFWLHDTFGFPVDVTRDIVEDSGLKFDQAGFDECLAKAQDASRKGSKFTGEVFTTDSLEEVRKQHPPTEYFDETQTPNRRPRVIWIEEYRFTGYTDGVIRTGTVRLVQKIEKDKDKDKEERVILDSTPFYAEAGGQVCDTGELRCGDSIFEVTETRKKDGHYIHVGKVKEGSFKVGDKVTAIVSPQRKDTERNHSATHLLQYALRKVLGPTVEQAGSLVEPERLRFDFTFSRALTLDEIAKVEAIVNERILVNDAVTFEETTVEAAKARGVIALFGEKYGEKVRVVNIGGYSMELCGGTHVRRTGDIGLFKILREGSVASGVRRIEAVTGNGVLACLNAATGTITELARKLKCREDGLLQRVEDLLDEVAGLKKKAAAKAVAAKSESGADLLARAEKVGGTLLVCEHLSDHTMPELRDLADELRARAGSAAVVLMAKSDGKVSLIVAFTKDLVEAGKSAVDVAKKIGPIIGGGGGGRADLAQSGGKDPAKIDEAIAEAKSLLKAMLGGK